jgi:DNA-binding transcriptional ArsR family regulator
VATATAVSTTGATYDSVHVSSLLVRDWVEGGPRTKSHEQPSASEHTSSSALVHPPRQRRARIGSTAPTGEVPLHASDYLPIMTSMTEGLLQSDLLFKALADPSRRRLLDLLHAHDGRTLNELCEHLDITRQGVTQHLDLLEAANLVATARRGREKLHFLNPVPLQQIYERWIAKFEKPRLKALADLKRRLEKANG